jgi:hypothetical protein
MKNINVIKKPIISMKKNLSFWDSLLKSKQPLKYNTLINFKKINIFKKKSNFQNYLEFNNKKGINKLNKSTIKIKKPYNSVSQSINNSKNKIINFSFIQNINNNNLSNNNFIFSFGKRIENYNLKRNISLPSIKDYLINSLSRSDREKDDMKIYGYRLRYTNNLDLKKKSIDETIQTKINNINYHYILKNKFLKNVYN